MGGGGHDHLRARRELLLEAVEVAVGVEHVAAEEVAQDDRHRPHVDGGRRDHRQAGAARHDDLGRRVAHRAARGVLGAVGLRAQVRVGSMSTQKEGFGSTRRDASEVRGRRVRVRAGCACREGEGGRGGGGTCALSKSMSFHSPLNIKKCFDLRSQWTKPRSCTAATICSSRCAWWRVASSDSLRSPHLVGQTRWKWGRWRPLAETSRPLGGV